MPTGRGSRRGVHPQTQNASTTDTNSSNSSGSHAGHIINNGRGMLQLQTKARKWLFFFFQQFCCYLQFMQKSNVDLWGAASSYYLERRVVGRGRGAVAAGAAVAAATGLRPADGPAIYWFSELSAWVPRYLCIACHFFLYPLVAAAHIKDSRLEASD